MAKATMRQRPGQQQSYVVALVGADLGTTLTPALHEREAGMLGLQYVYRTVDIAELGLSESGLGQMLAAARWLGFAGLNITHPCKQLVLQFIDEMAPDAAAIGAVNTVVIDNGRTVGHNTDWTGFVNAFRKGLPGASLDTVLLMGAGGAGSAVAYALLTLGAGRVVVADLRAATAAALAESLGRQFGSERITTAPLERIADEVASADGLVNATPAGMAGRADLPLPKEQLHPSLWVADVVYRPLATPLLVAAGEQGCRTLPGGGMAVYQAAHALRLFTGAEPDEQRMLAHFNELLAVVGHEGGR